MFLPSKYKADWLQRRLNVYYLALYRKGWPMLMEIPDFVACYQNKSHLPADL